MNKQITNNDKNYELIFNALNKAKALADLVIKYDLLDQPPFNYSDLSWDLSDKLDDAWKAQEYIDKALEIFK